MIRNKPLDQCDGSDWHAPFSPRRVFDRCRPFASCMTFLSNCSNLQEQPSKMYNTLFGALPIGSACVIKSRSPKGSIAGLITLTNHSTESELAGHSSLIYTVRLDNSLHYGLFFAFFRRAKASAKRAKSMRKESEEHAQRERRACKNKRLLCRLLEKGIKY